MSKFQNMSAVSTNLHFAYQTTICRFAMATMLLLGIAFSTGCSTLPSALSSAGLLSDSAEAPVATGSQPQYLVDMQTFSGSKKYRGTIGPGATVQSAVEASGALKKFRKMDIVVLRKVEGAFQPLKMTCDYNSAKKMVRSESDYALRHGDRVVITPKSENSLLQMLGTFSEGR